MASQFVILSREPGSGNGMAPIAPREEILQRLADYNTMPERPDEADVLHGPGIRIELPPDDPVTQMLLTVVEEEIAWLVIMRLGKAMQWKILDTTTGRELNP